MDEPVSPSEGPPPPDESSPASEHGVPQIAARLRPATRPAVLPAALRVFLYMLSWLFLAGLASFVATLSYALLMVVSGRGDLVSILQQAIQPSSGRLENIPLLLVNTVAELVGTVLVTLLFTTFLDRRSFLVTSFLPVRGWGRQCALGFALDAAHMSVVFGTGFLAGWYQVTATASPANAVFILGVALLVALPAAAIEEITMRGYVLPVLEERYGTVAAVVANSLVFALLHLANPHSLNPMVMAGLFLAGVYFSVAYVATRQLWLPICGHAMWNIMEGPVYGLPVSGLEMPATVLRVTVHGPAWGTGGSFGPEAGVPVLVTTLAWTGLVWWAARRLLPRSGE